MSRKDTLTPKDSKEDFARTGVEGLDDVLGGGLPRNRLYLVQGDPGVGKTTLGLQFLLQGRDEGETGLYVSLSETSEELGAVAVSHGWNLEGINLHELSTLDPSMVSDLNTLFHPSEVELQETAQTILDIIEQARPQRVVIDSLSELRLLAQTPLRYRRQVLWLKQFFANRRCTVILLDDGTTEDRHLQSLAHGVILLEQLSPLYGAARRRLRVLKVRGIHFRGGYHDFNIAKGGLQIFPRLVAAEHHSPFNDTLVCSGVADLDAMVGGGLARGTSTLILGPAGTGKSVLAAQYLFAAAARNERGVAYLFDESISTFCARSASLGIPMEHYTDKKTVSLHQIDPAEISPGEFIHRVRLAVEKDNARVVLIDSLNGYMTSMPEENFLLVQLHELLSYLRHKGIVAMLVAAQLGMLGAHMQATVEISYLADTVLILRYFETAGEIRKAVSVMKKRSGRHELAIRELHMTDKGLVIGPALKAFHGVLTGVPTYKGTDEQLRREESDG